ncbi:hypothetical protein [Parasitella parasitica]|uniref:F-box domain-containing protein n=1 Tax=Parasitella parasitica TaxID=35722 RepID=A0A0B7N558_9FUNG|nr:hypothetical protein [Parasitella parasitica]
MDKLPRELHLYILSYLNFKDKLQCSLVSQEWHNRLKHNVLYHALLFRNPDYLEQAIQFFSDKTFRLSVHRVDMSLCELPISSFIKLPLVFPRLRQLHIADFDPKFKSARRSLEEEAAIMDLFEKGVQRWEYLEEIVEKSGNYPVIMSFLKAPKPVYLTSINITYNKRHGSIGKYRHNLQTLIKLTKNAPFLKRFCARFTFMSLLDFEQLHLHCPNLNTISITTQICDISADLDRWFDNAADFDYFVPYYRANIEGVSPVKPAQHLKYLKIKVAKSFTAIRETEITAFTIDNWLRYIGQKYPNLSSLDFHKISNGLQGTQAPEKQFEESMFCVLSKLTHLESLNSNIVPFTTKVVKSMSNSAGKLNNCTLHSYKHYTVQKQLDSLQFMNQSNQLKSIQIVSNKNSSLHGPIDFVALNTFCNLTQFTLTSQIDHSQIQVSLLLSYASNLEFLALSGVCPTFDVKKTGRQRTASKLKTLQIRKFSFFRSLDWLNLNLSLKNDVLPYCPKLTRFDFSTIRAEYCDKARSDTPFLLALDFRSNLYLEKVNVNLLASKAYRINGRQEEINLCPFAVFPLFPEGIHEYPACTLIDLPHSVLLNKDIIE